MDKTSSANGFEDYFNRELLPILTPIGLDASHPFPRPLNKSLNFVVELDGKDAFGRASGMAIVQAPRILPARFGCLKAFAMARMACVFVVHRA